MQFMLSQDLFQPLLLDPLLRHSFTTRLLSCVIPSNWYAKHDASVIGIMDAIANDMTDLFENGITVSVSLKNPARYQTYD